ncbi:ATP-binding protein [Streptomyces pactum]|uniref:ATP-binding protein n=1 Tax=Streptomyces pactum TaxID=68249 RepID=A0ABS0NKZ8_9ACTN|nr:ATP-binding protein [Streptomyces pactum]MBH5335860.1 ATP-binding protein [Streptomyces pactum]
MSIWWSLHLRREAASVPLARRLLLGTMEAAGVDPEISHDLSLALTEACANAVEHGGADEAGRHYRVTAYIDGDTCRIEVTDSGPGFLDAPAADGDPGPAGLSSRLPEPAGPPAELEVRVPAPPRASPPRRCPPAPVHAEHGRGLFLIEALTDHVRYRNRSGCSGAVVSFDKILKWREGALLKAS